MNWEDYRNPDDSLDILKALEDRHEAKPLKDFHIGYSIVSAISSLYPIKSRQVATTILIFAIQLSDGAA